MRGSISRRREKAAGGNTCRHPPSNQLPALAPAISMSYCENPGACKMKDRLKINLLPLPMQELGGRPLPLIDNVGGVLGCTTIAVGCETLQACGSHVWAIQTATTIVQQPKLSSAQLA